MPTKRQRELTAEAELRALQLIVGSMLSFAFIGTGDPEKEASRFAEAIHSPGCASNIATSCAMCSGVLKPLSI